MPIIFITAFPDESIRARALDAGAVCFLTKPFDGPTLIKYLDAALRGMARNWRVARETRRPIPWTQSGLRRLHKFIWKYALTFEARVAQSVCNRTLARRRARGSKTRRPIVKPRYRSVKPIRCSNQPP